MLILQELPGLATLQLPAETPFCLQGASGEPAAVTLPCPSPAAALTQPNPGMQDRRFGVTRPRYKPHLAGAAQQGNGHVSF